MSQHGRKKKSWLEERQINVDLPVDLHDRLDDFCEKNGLKKKKFIEWAIRKLLKEKQGDTPKETA